MIFDPDLSETFTGVELIVSGLRRTSLTSATEHLNSLLAEQRTRGTHIPPVTIVSPANQRPLDFVYLSLAGEFREQPRPDILDDLRQIVDSFDGITALWKTAAGNTDKTRQLSFLADEFLNATQLKSRLEAIFTSHAYTFQTGYIPNNSDRIVFAFTKRESVLRLLQQPPVIDGRSYLPVTPRYIQPLYGLEIAINGISDIGGAKVRIDRHLEAHYGGHPNDPVVRHSRLELGGSVYCCILRTPAITSRFLSDPWDLFNDDMGFNVSRPVYLYVLNSKGVPNVPAFARAVPSSQAPDPVFQRQLDLLNTRSDNFSATLEHLSRQQESIVTAFHETQDTLQTAFRHAEQSFTLTNMLALTQAEATTQQTNCAMLQLVLGLTQDSTQRQNVQAQLAATEQKITETNQKRQQLETSIYARQSLPPPTHTTQNDQPAPNLVTLPIPLPAPDSAASGYIPAAPIFPPTTSQDSEVRANKRPRIDSQPSNAVASTSAVTLDNSPAHTDPMRIDTVCPLSFPLSLSPVHECSKYLSPGLNAMSTKDLPVEQNKLSEVSPDMGGDLTSHPSYHLLSALCSIALTFIFFLFSLRAIVLFLLLVQLFHFPINASDAPSNHATLGLRTLSLNSNGLGDPMKISAISNMVARVKPHVVVIGETKNTNEVHHRLNLPDYDFFESPARPTPAHTGKWGVIMGIRRGLLHANRVTVPETLHGRAVVLDLVIPTVTGRGFIHRLVGVYAPWNPGGTSQDQQNSFWPSVLELCRNARFSWSLIGDLNVCLTTDETTSLAFPYNHSRSLYLNFLHSSMAIDVWRSQPDTVASQHFYTCKTRTRYPNSDVTHMIIDRAACSRTGTTSASLSILSDFIPATDHRPILLHATLHAPPTMSAPSIPYEIPPAAYAPRFRFPPKSDHYRFSNFARRVDELLAEHPNLMDINITSDESFECVYTTLGTILKAAAEEAFLTPTFTRHTPRKITSPAIQSLCRELRRVNRLIASLRPVNAQNLHNTRVVFPQEPWVQNYLSAFPDFNPFSPETFILLRNHLISLRRSLHKIRYAEERAERVKRTEARSASQIRYVLNGGSSKYLYPSKLSSLPLALVPSPASNPDLIVTDPTQVKQATISYFEGLYSRTARPPQTKPWIDTPSVKAMAEQVRSDPFIWPQSLQLTDLRALLSKGNSRPTPGPDGWEKWMVRRVHDGPLRAVLALVNYIVQTAHCPPCIKPTNISTIHKRGPNTHLANYRGIACSNLLLNLPFAWLNSLLTPYLTKHHIIPNCQVATQPGVQGRDLISFIGQCQNWASRERLPLFILQRDQKKGFDMLEPQGFYDALAAYSLPSAIADLDRSAQSNVPYRVKTAYGFTSFFPVHGVTKQGGSLSPLKCTLTTSLCNRWLQDSQQRTPGQLLIQTHNARQGIFHEPADNICLPLSMIEAMDDSLLISPDLPSLSTAARMADRFQATNGWETNWLKSRLYVYQASPDVIPANRCIAIPSVDYTNPQSERTFWNDVLVETDHTTFLRVPVNRPDLQFLRLQDIIVNFAFPVLSRPLPITILRRIVSQQIISKVRPHLAFQPLPPSLASKLDTILATKIHSRLGFPFRFKTELLFAPLSMRGFAFPSISALNAAMAVQGLQRDLNHHIQPFRDIACVTLADWSCSFNGCRNPLQFESQSSPSHGSAYIPSAWQSARNFLVSFHISFLPTDYSFITAGNISLRHLHNSLRSFIPSHAHLLTRTISNFERHSFQLLHTFGSFVSCPHSSIITSFRPAILVFPSSQYYLARDWPAVRTWFSFLVPALHHLTRGNSSLLYSRSLRQSLTEQSVLSLTHLPGPTISPNHLPPEGYFASDASSRTINGLVSTTFAALGDSSALVARLGGPHQPVSILQGEAYGIASMSLLAERALHSTPHLPLLQLYTDHLNSITTLASRLSDFQLKTHPARSAYRWIASIWTRLTNTHCLAPSLSARTLSLPVCDIGHPLLLTHSPAHTDSTSLPAMLNRTADTLASSSNYPLYPPSLPLPTFAMDDYMPFSTRHGFIESNILSFISSLYHSTFSASLDTLHVPTFLSLYSTIPSPAYPYLKALSAFSAALQLYLRSGQLDCALTLANRRFPADSQPWCRFGCSALEDARHIFVVCPYLATVRHDHQTDVSLWTADLLLETPLTQTIKHRVQALADSLFEDSLLWPASHTYYYLGLTPPLPTTGLSTLQLRLFHRIGQEWHTRSIRLAARLWGLVRKEQRLRQQHVSASTSPLFRRILTLPRFLASSLGPVTSTLNVSFM